MQTNANNNNKTYRQRTKAADDRVGRAVTEAVEGAKQMSTSRAAAPAVSAGIVSVLGATEGRRGMRTTPGGRGTPDRDGIRIRIFVLAKDAVAAATVGYLIPVLS